MANVNLIKWLKKNERVDEILKQGYGDYDKQSTFGRKINYKDWKRRFLVWIFFYLSEIEFLLPFIKELNKRATYRRRLGFRKDINYKSIWNFRRCIRPDTFDKIIILCVHLLQKRGIIGRSRNRWSYYR